MFGIVAFVDPEINELKELMRRNIHISEQTNRMVRSMHKDAMWSKFFRFLWTFIVIGLAVYGYYYFQPYILQIERLYTQAQMQLGHIQNIPGR